MAELKYDKFTAVEPLKSNRFVITCEGVDIPEYLFRGYSLYNEGKNLIFKTKFFETVNYSFNPKEFFNVTSVTIEYLDPTGHVVNALKFNVSGSNFKRKQSYKSDDLQLNKLRFIVDINSMVLLYKSNENEKDS